MKFLKILMEFRHSEWYRKFQWNFVVGVLSVKKCNHLAIAKWLLFQWQDTNNQGIVCHFAHGKDILEEYGDSVAKVLQNVYPEYPQDNEMLAPQRSIFHEISLAQ